MKNTDFELVKHVITKYGTYLVIAILLFLLLIQRGNNSDLTFDVKKQKEIVAISNKRSKALLKEANELKQESLKLKNKLVILKKDSLGSYVKIKELNILLSSKLHEIKEYKTNDIALYFKKRYKANEGVVITKYGVSLNDTIAKKNISELVNFDSNKEEIKIFKSDIKNRNEIISEQDKIIVNSEKQNEYLQLSISEINKSFEASNTIASDNEKMYKKEKAKKNFWKAATGVVITGAAYLIIFK